MIQNTYTQTHINVTRRGFHKLVLTLSTYEAFTSLLFYSVPAYNMDSILFFSSVLNSLLICLIFLIVGHEPIIFILLSIIMTQ